GGGAPPRSVSPQEATMMNSSARRHLDVEEIQQRPASRPARTSGSRPLVALLIAGEPEEAGMYSAKLRRDGYAVVPATGLERGLALALAARPDLIFVCVGAWAVPALVLLVLRSDP